MEKILNQILEKVNSLENQFSGRMDKLDGRMDKLEQNQNEMGQDLKRLSKKVDIIFEQTAGLLEFKTEMLHSQNETKQILRRHETDIELLKKVVAR